MGWNRNSENQQKCNSDRNFVNPLFRNPSSLVIFDNYNSLNYYFEKVRNGGGGVPVVNFVFGVKQFGENSRRALLSLVKKMAFYDLFWSFIDEGDSIENIRGRGSL